MKHESVHDLELFSKLDEAEFGVDCPSEKMPDLVEMATDDNGSIIGFIAGHWNYDDSFYIQFAGVVPEHRNNGYTAYLKQMLKSGVSYICVTENTNVAAMRTLLTIGFLPIGMRHGGQQECFIEWTRRA